MNILEILWKLGYDVLSFNEDGEYKIQFGKARQVKEGYTEKRNIVKVKEVGFNGFGNLYVTFTEVGTDNCFDSYEYKNMGSDELF